MCLEIDIDDYNSGKTFKPHDDSKYRWKAFGSAVTMDGNTFSERTELSNRYRHGLVAIGKTQVAKNGERAMTRKQIRERAKRNQFWMLEKIGLHVFVSRRDALNDNRTASHVHYLAKVKVSGHIASGKFCNYRAETWHKYKIVELWMISRDRGFGVRTKSVWRAKKTGARTAK